MMAFFNRYSWKQKNKFLWWGSLLFLVLAYQLSIKKTLSLQQEYRGALGQQVKSQEAAAELAGLKQRIGTMNYDKADRGAGATMVKTEQLNSIATMAEQYQLNLTEVPVTTTVSSNGLQVHYEVYGLQGTYGNLLKGWHMIEQDKSMNLVNVSFRKETNAYTREMELKMYLTTAYTSNLE